AVIAAGIGIIADKFEKDIDNKPPVPDIPPIIMETTAEANSKLTTMVNGKSSTMEVNNKSTTAINVEPLITETNSKPATTVNGKSSNIEADNKSTTAINVELFTMKTDSKLTTTINDKPLITTTSVYYSQIFRHDYTITETAQDDSLIYGYPDSDIVRQFFADFGIENTGYPLYMEMALGISQAPVVEGEIISVEYTDLNGKPLTICDVRISEVFDFYVDDVMNMGDVIRIAMYGGYMPVSEYIALNPDDTIFENWSQEQIDSTILYEAGGNEIMPEVGDSYLFALYNDKREVNGKLLYFQLAYSDVFRFYRNGDDYICCNSAADGSITYEQMKRITDNSKYYFHEPDGNRKIMIKDGTFLIDGVQHYYSVKSDGTVAYLGSSGTDDGFFPYHSVENYTITWNDSDIVIKYHTHSDNDYYETIVLDYPK
ncbi:MAG: hypothetical protein K2J47_06265, partial [Ruminococcus sp.]|nr:hypothetical protein [Ruminococcus sp.]